MELSKIVVSLPLSRKLKKVGVKQESHFWHYLNAGEAVGAIVDGYQDKDDEFKKAKLVSAFTSGELGEMLPASVFTERFGDKAICNYVANDFSKSASFSDENEANARAKMLIHLIEQGIYKV